MIIRRKYTHASAVGGLRTVPSHFLLQAGLLVMVLSLYPKDFDSIRSHYGKKIWDEFKSSSAYQILWNKRVIKSLNPGVIG